MRCRVSRETRGGAEDDGSNGVVTQEGYRGPPKPKAHDPRSRRIGTSHQCRNGVHPRAFGGIRKCIDVEVVGFEANILELGQLSNHCRIKLGVTAQRSPHNVDPTNWSANDRCHNIRRGTQLAQSFRTGKEEPEKIDGDISLPDDDRVSSDPNVANIFVRMTVDKSRQSPCTVDAVQVEARHAVPSVAQQSICVKPRREDDDVERRSELGDRIIARIGGGGGGGHR